MFNPSPIPIPPPAVLTRRERLLKHDVEASDDPICSCEAEPRWLRFQQECDHPGCVSEWESIERVPSDEL